MFKWKPEFCQKNIAKIFNLDAPVLSVKQNIESTVEVQVSFGLYGWFNSRHFKNVCKNLTLANYHANAVALFCINHMFHVFRFKIKHELIFEVKKKNFRKVTYAIFFRWKKRRLWSLESERRECVTETKTMIVFSCFLLLLLFIQFILLFSSSWISQFLVF